MLKSININPADYKRLTRLHISCVTFKDQTTCYVKHASV